MTMMGPLATANQQIRDAERQAIELRVARLKAPHRMTDRLLDQLEELNLDGIRTVPDYYEKTLDDLRQQLDGQQGLSQRLLDRLQPGTRTAELIETVFAIQEVIAPPILPADDFPLDDGLFIEPAAVTPYPSASLTAR
jgi:hypothetical protein